jgi:hypothetical protein
VIAIVPGALGNVVFTRLVGTDWREKELSTVVRVLAFSVFGLALYAWIAVNLGWPPPSHILPSTYTAAGLTDDVVGRLAPGYVGHTLGGGLTGAVAAVGLSILGWLTGRSAHAAAWDEFVATCVSKRWVVVTLIDGNAFCGKIETADASVDATQRDLLLTEPAQYDSERGDYLVMGYRHLFLRASQIDSVATLRNSQMDSKLLTSPGEPLFGGTASE